MTKFKQETLDTLREFREFSLSLKSKRDRLKNKLGKVDGKVNDLLHLIEGVCDAHSIHFTKIYKELKSVLSDRRAIKNECGVLQAVADSIASEALINKAIKNVEGIPKPKSYTNRYYSKGFEELLKEKNNRFKMDERSP